MIRTFIIAALLGISACGGGEREREPAPRAAPAEKLTVFTGGTIYTGHDANPVVTSVVVRADGRIAAIAPPASEDWSGDEVEIVDLGGAFMYPGFVDSHAHLLGIGQRELRFDLTGTASLAELVARLEAEVAEAEPGDIIFGRGWIETGWPERRMPSIADIDPVSPDNPVILTRADGHALVANSEALDAAGIGFDTLNPSGGMIERSDDGQATGILIDNAMEPVLDLIEAPDEDDIIKALAIGAEEYASRGWTGIHNMSVQPKEAPLLERLDLEGRMPLRLHNAYDSEGFDIAAERRHETDTIQNRAVKLYLDGALGSRGAQLTAPYSDRPETSGLSLLSNDDLTQMMGSAAENRVQLAIHAIGDLANKRVLDTIEGGFADAAGALRWRIEHAQILRVEDIERFAAMGVIASMQPSHAIGDMFFAPDRLGPARLRGAYAWDSLIQSGAVIAGGSDAPVEVGSPLIEFYAAVARKSLDGYQDEDWQPGEAVSRHNALKMFTAWPAYASGQEDDLGTITPGKFADFTVFDRDLMEVPEDEILSAEAVMTVVAGDIVYQRPGEAP